jgi:hypothetical protein
VQATLCESDAEQVPPLPAGQLMSDGVLVMVPAVGRVTVSVCVTVVLVAPPPGGGGQLRHGAAAAECGWKSAKAPSPNANVMTAISNRRSIEREQGIGYLP